MLFSDRPDSWITTVYEIVVVENSMNLFHNLKKLQLFWNIRFLCNQWNFQPLANHVTPYLLS
jgi:hypothetical protein